MEIFPLALDRRKGVDSALEATDQFFGQKPVGPPVCRTSVPVLLQGLEDDEVVFQNRADMIARQDEVIGLGG